MGGWMLFDGQSLQGWRPSENKASWKVVNGQLAADGPRSHLFYDGPVKGANFRNFELEVDAMARPGCNSGVYFHTAYQETNFPQKGFEVQIANTAGGENGYQERKKTGSLYGIAQCLQAIHRRRPVVQDARGRARQERAGPARTECWWWTTRSPPRR